MGDGTEDTPEDESPTEIAEACTMVARKPDHQGKAAKRRHQKQKKRKKRARKKAGRVGA